MALSIQLENTWESCNHLPVHDYFDNKTEGKKRNRPVKKSYSSSCLTSFGFKTTDWLTHYRVHPSIGNDPLGSCFQPVARSNPFVWIGAEIWIESISSWPCLTWIRSYSTEVQCATHAKWIAIQLTLTRHNSTVKTSIEVQGHTIPVHNITRVTKHCDWNESPMNGDVRKGESKSKLNSCIQVHSKAGTQLYFDSQSYHCIFGAQVGTLYCSESQVYLGFRTWINGIIP